MKKILILSIAVFFVSCSSFTYVKNILKERWSVQQFVDTKEEMDKMDNEAFVYENTQKLKNKRIRIENVIIRDIITSSNVDYKFCAIITVPSSKGDIECYVYAGTDEIFPKEDIKTISKLKKGITVVDIEGDFSRFFTLFDETYTKIEIVNASIDIKNQ